jgi:thioredoxin 1
MSAATGLRSVTDESFAADVLASPVPVIVEYWAPWCGPCRMVGPEYAGKVEVFKINADENPHGMLAYGVTAVPTIMLFSAGQLVGRVVGARSKSALLREFAAFLPVAGDSAEPSLLPERQQGFSAAPRALP